MASPFDRIIMTARPNLPGVIDDAVRQELFMVCLDFFKRSNAWQEEIKFTLKPNCFTADVQPFAGRIERLLYVKQENRFVQGATMEDIMSGQIRMRSSVNEPTVYGAIVALTVTDPVTRDAYPIVPQEIVARYTEELLHGLYSRMMSQPSKPYTNLSLAQFYMTKFNGGAARALNALKTGDTLGSQRWGFPQTFSNR